MNILFPYSIPIPFLSDFYDHIMSQQNANNVSSTSPCSTPSVQLPSSQSSSSMITANSTTLPHSYNLAAEILNSLAVQHRQTLSSSDSKNSLNDNISQKLQFESPLTLHNLSLHLSNMTNSPLNSIQNNNINSYDFSNHIRTTLNDDWNKCTDTLPTTCRQSRPVMMSTVEDVSSCALNSNNDLSNPYERLVSWSSSLSNVSPCAVAAFQHALAQLALLGLSTSTSTTTPTSTNGLDSHNLLMDKATNLNESISPVLNLSNGSANYKLLDNYCTNTNCDIPLSVSTSNTLNQTTMYKKLEEGSKVIIRQTADADEHFFKALRGLKVDVSTDLKSPDLRNQSNDFEKSEITPTISLPTSTSFLSFDFNEEKIQQWSKHMDEKQGDKKRSAAELAVDEHFEKSLAAFRASTSKKQNDHIVYDDYSKSSVSMSHSKNQNLINTLTLKNSDLYLHSDRCKTHTTKSQHKSLQTVSRGEPYDVNSILQYGDTKPTSNPNLSMTCENIHFSPSSLSRQLTSADDVHDDIGNNVSFQVYNPTVTITATAVTNRFRMKFASSSTSLPPLFPINSFKPKKNWLAQYDWRYQQSETTNISPTTPNTNQSIFDSSGSSPSSVNITSESMEDVQHISNISMPKLHIISELRNANTLDNSNYALSTEEAPDLKSDSDCIFASSSYSPLPSSRSSSCSSNNLVESSTTNNPVAEQLQLVNTLTKSRFSFPKIGTTLLVEKDDYFENESRDKSTNEEHITDNTFNEKEKNECTEIKSSKASRNNIKTTATTTVTTTTTTMMSNNYSVESNRNRTLSSSISSSPTVYDDDNEQVIDENESTGNIFSNGSTYSLDSTNASSLTMNSSEKNSANSEKDHIHNSNNNNNKLKDEVNNKCTIIQQSQLHQNQNHNNQHHHSHQQHVTNETNDNDDTLHNIWSLRKRVSTEVSPWSTLKRSRSIVTSAGLSSDKCSINTVSSSDVGSEEAYQLDNNDDCEMYNTTNDRGFVHSKSMDSTLNPFDSNDSNSKFTKCHKSSRKSINDNELLTGQKKTCSEPNVPDSRTNILEKKLLVGALSFPSFHQLESCHQNS
ncbi:hypothetical protein MN116_006970 [Schistosoma mekongi]|uniref:Uncharacterized protein n=1 Tax=Schistosoma mekongi TaxID=38744 RepID=A0AAE1Z876_SCHME|nr:hypothetical protein MN116_006970 [Schistosoma mekongi]